MARSKKIPHHISQYQPSRGMAKNRFRYGNNTVTGAINLYDAISTGFDLVKSHTKTGTTTKRETKLKPKNIAHGWYVDTISGLNHSFPKSFQSVINSSGQQSQMDQEPIKQDAILSRANSMTVLNLHPLTKLIAQIHAGTNFFLTTQTWKLMFTNMSNVKICYEYYYVTPKGNQPFTFQAEIDALTIGLTGGAAVNTVFTNWRPSDTPQVLKNYNILGKSVFRLGPGETGELHCRDKIYKKFGQADIMPAAGGQTVPQYAHGSNTQLYCRWYGCPTGIAQTAALSLVTDAVFGDHTLATSWIAESKYFWYEADRDNPNFTLWNTNVKNAVSGTETVVANVETDQNNTAAR